MQPGIASGAVTHRRLVDRTRRFTRRLSLVVVDLDRTSMVEESPFWRTVGFPGSSRRWRPAELRRRDFLPELDGTLSDAVRNLVEGAGGNRPNGPVLLVTQPRLFGWCFNPLSCYLCLDEGGGIEAAVLEVTNTPWGERHPYVLLGPGPWSFDKALHVSPFLEDDRRYEASISLGAAHLALRLTLLDGSTPELESRLLLRLRPLDRAGLRHLALTRGWQALAGSAAIYAHAAILLLRRVPVVPHPRTRAASTSERAVADFADASGAVS